MTGSLRKLQEHRVVSKAPDARQDQNLRPVADKWKPNCFQPRHDFAGTASQRPHANPCVTIIWSNTTICHVSSFAAEPSPAHSAIAVSGRHDNSATHSCDIAPLTAPAPPISAISKSSLTVRATTAWLNTINSIVSSAFSSLSRRGPSCCVVLRHPRLRPPTKANARSFGIPNNRSVESSPSLQRRCGRRKQRLIWPHGSDARRAPQNFISQATANGPVPPSLQSSPRSLNASSGA